MHYIICFPHHLKAMCDSMFLFSPIENMLRSVTHAKTRHYFSVGFLEPITPSKGVALEMPVQTLPLFLNPLVPNPLCSQLLFHTKKDSRLFRA